MAGEGAHMRAWPLDRAGRTALNFGLPSPPPSRFADGDRLDPCLPSVLARRPSPRSFGRSLTPCPSPPAAERTDMKNIGCDPSDRPTAAYIDQHLDLYRSV